MFKEIPVPTSKEEAKNFAKELLAETDYTVLPDSEVSNQEDFIWYRKYLRNILRNPLPIFILPCPDAILKPAE
jgi:hypothetical protein